MLYCDKHKQSNVYSKYMPTNKHQSKKFSLLRIKRQENKNKSYAKVSL